MIQKLCVSALVFAVLILPGSTLRAQQITPAQQAAVGTWDFGDGGIVETYVKDGALYGKLIHTNSKVDNNSVCKKCDGELKNKPFIGMVNIYGFKPEGTTEVWGGGRFVDITTGLVAQGKIKAENGGATLNVRGYFGSPLLGQTVIWKRIK